MILTQMIVDLKESFSFNNVMIKSVNYIRIITVNELIKMKKNLIPTINVKDYSQVVDTSYLPN